MITPTSHSPRCALAHPLPDPGISLVGSPKFVGKDDQADSNTPFGIERDGSTDVLKAHERGLGPGMHSARLAIAESGPGGDSALLVGEASLSSASSRRHRGCAGCDPDRRWPMIVGRRPNPAAASARREIRRALLAPPHNGPVRTPVAGNRRHANPCAHKHAPAGKRGFTLIELVSVIVVLGALAVVGLPRFINLQDEAQRAALEGVAGSAGAAHALNLSAALADPDGGEAQPVTGCDDTSTILQGGRPEGYNFPDNPFAPNDPIGTAQTCTVVQRPTGDTATFTAYSVPP